MINHGRELIILFNKYMENFILVFIDDILVYSKSKKEHKEHLCIVLWVCSKSATTNRKNDQFSSMIYFKKLYKSAFRIFDSEGTLNLEELRVILEIYEILS